MKKAAKTTGKLPAKPFTGKEGNTFSKDNQPSSELKKKGWEQWRKERILTQEIIKRMVGTDGQPTTKMNTFINKLFTNANKGNPKAIDVLTKSIEDQEAIKIALNIPLLSIDPLSDTDDSTNNGA